MKFSMLLWKHRLPELRFEESGVLAELTPRQDEMALMFRIPRTQHRTPDLLCLVQSAVAASTCLAFVELQASHGSKSNTKSNAQLGNLIASMRSQLKLDGFAEDGNGHLDPPTRALAVLVIGIAPAFSDKQRLRSFFDTHGVRLRPIYHASTKAADLRHAMDAATRW